MTPPSCQRPALVRARMIVFIYRLLKQVLKRVLSRTRSAPAHQPPTLLDLPVDILELIFQILLNLEAMEEPYDHEVCNRALLIPLSETCRCMRTLTLPWIFREVYNWSRAGVAVWPETLWPFFVTVHIRDRSVRHPAEIPISPQLFRALPRMLALRKVTLRLSAAVPTELLSALSLAPNLFMLEIHQARLDALLPHTEPSFASLTSLSICISGFHGVIRVPNIDGAAEVSNMLALLRILANQITRLRISGDLLPPEFPALHWPKLHDFAITDHTPTPFISVPELVAQMPALRVLSVLFTADMTRQRGELFPPFILGVTGGQFLTNSSLHLTSVTLSNLKPEDPIFGQLPRSLESLHLLAMRDWYAPTVRWPSEELGDAPLRPHNVFGVLDRLSHLECLVDLSLTLGNLSSSDLINTIASKLPQLQRFQLGHPIFSDSEIHLIDFRHEPYLEALRRFQFLQHLKISLDIRRPSYERGPPANAAYWLLQDVPGLQTVSFRHYFSPGPAVWHTWDRSLLRHPPPHPLPLNTDTITIQPIN
ncbi:hypothetical protein DFH07DRAFT_431391 [Mycena maculata]|uniref:Uncharacterized protein n=1 Tax=Mycena maculata TaxID=230809 RepID=A0AAD7NFP0_9AGAR|nr:hypothetical protein DFH07DRAFT_431391 [Mycena maculata]